MPTSWARPEIESSSAGERRTARRVVLGNASVDRLMLLFLELSAAADGGASARTPRRASPSSVEHE